MDGGHTPTLVRGSLLYLIGFVHGSQQVYSFYPSSLNLHSSRKRLAMCSGPFPIFLYRMITTRFSLRVWFRGGLYHRQDAGAARLGQPVPWHPMMGGFESF
jgi:hypothetical protein